MPSPSPRRCPHASASLGSRHPRWVLGSAGTLTPARSPVSPPWHLGVSSSRSHASFCACVRGHRCAPQPGPLRGACRRNSAGGQLGGARWPPEPRRTVSSRLCAVTRAAVTEPTARRSLGGHRACARARARIPSLLSARGWLANDLRWHASCRRESRPRGLLPPGARLPF